MYVEGSPDSSVTSLLVTTSSLSKVISQESRVEVHLLEHFIDCCRKLNTPGKKIIY